MTLAIEPTQATLGAVVTGVRLARLAPGEWEAIEAAFHQHAVLVVPGQHLSNDEQLSVGRRFGELEIATIEVTNLGPDGHPRDRDDPELMPYLGNEHWHSDSSFRPVSAKASMLSARVIPDAGGETEWADLRAAYDELSPEEQHWLGRGRRSTPTTTPSARSATPGPSTTDTPPRSAPPRCGRW